MRRILGFFVMVMTLAWPGLGLGQEYVFGKDSDAGKYNAYSGASAGNGGKTGFYLAPRFLDSLTNTGDINGSGGRASKTRNTLGGALAAGFYLNRLDSRLPLRAEIEYAGRGDVRTSWDRSSAISTGKFKALFNVQTLQANVYWDIDTGTAFKPFVGGGLGASFIYADYTLDGRSYDDSTTGFAWNAGAGVAYDINESVTVDLAYRFAGFGHAEAKLPGSTTKNYMTANEFLLGLRLNF
jgi:opacity protein-like surface antigen